MSAPTAEATTGPRVVVGWREHDSVWHARRRDGISASDVAAVLGFSQYATPWEVWADKTGVRQRSVDADKPAIRLGVAMEPWLLAQARHMLGCDVRRTSHRLYAHHEDAWQLASPDGEAVPEDGEPFGVEAKTAGLASGFGVPEGWTDTRAPLGYEFQCRWQMRVMGWQKVFLVALVAHRGLCTYTYHRDLSIEADMVAQVAEWRAKHLLGGVEPPMQARDNQLMDEMYPHPTEGEIKLDNHPDIIELMYAYTEALRQESEGKKAKETAGAAIKRIIGNHEVGTIANRVVATWKSKADNPRWRDLVEDLVEICGWNGPDLDLDDLIEQYRPEPNRSINVKGLG